MRRTIAIALAVGLLFAGGCGRQDRQGRRDQRPAAVPAASSASSVPAAGAASSAPAAPAASGDVDQLLDQIDQQLSGDAQPAADED
jgi:hypothetical protein